MDAYKKKFVIGIDPGRNGGIVGLTNGNINIIGKMPLQPSDIWGYFADDLGIPLIGKENIHVFIEDVHSMPTDGVRSAFSFGKHLGWLDMLLAYYHLDITRVVPSKWQEFFSLSRKTSGTDTKYHYKKYILETAKVLAPERYQKEITLATCDAYLIGLYGFNKLKEQHENHK